MGEWFVVWKERWGGGENWFLGGERFVEFWKGDGKGARLVGGIMRDDCIGWGNRGEIGDEI